MTDKLPEPTAKQRFDEIGGDDMPPLERLRFFCSLAMKGQDWLDVEPFFDAVARDAEEAVRLERERLSKPRDAFAEAAAMEPKPCTNCDGTMVGDCNGYNAFLRCQKCRAVPLPEWAESAAIRSRSREGQG